MKICCNKALLCFLTFSNFIFANENKNESSYSSINFQVGKINVFNDKHSKSLYTLELRNHPIVWKLIPSFGLSWSNNKPIYLYSDIKYKVKFSTNWGLLISTGMGVFNNTKQINLGHTIEFRSGAEINYQLKTKHSVGVSVYHYSNSKLGRLNPGTESISVSYSIPF